MSNPSITCIALQKTVVDGAFATNNPAAAAVAWMLQRTPRQDVVVLSIGNGDATFAVDGPEAVYQVHMLLGVGAFCVDVGQWILLRWWCCMYMCVYLYAYSRVCA